MVGEFRRELDPFAQLGVPAHVTVLFPFMPFEEITEDVLCRLAGLFRSVPSFQHSFVRTGWFGNDVLWLASDADAIFRSLTEQVTDAFPNHPPYEGQFDDVVPHLTIGDRGPMDAMKVAEQRVLRQLPIRTITREVTLLAEQPSGTWETAHSFALSDTDHTA